MLGQVISILVDIDKALCTGEYHRLMEIAQSNGFESLISNDVGASYEQCTDIAGGDLVLRQPNLEAQLLISNAELISQLEDEVQDFPEHAFCSCERLHQRKSLTRVNLSDELSHDVWPQLKSYVLEQTPDTGDHVLFMCKYCRHMIKQNKLPPRCVINGLQVVPMLSALDSLSIQLIQRAQCYQTIVRLCAQGCVQLVRVLVPMWAVSHYTVAGTPPLPFPASGFWHVVVH